MGRQMEQGHRERKPAEGEGPPGREAPQPEVHWRQTGWAAGECGHWLDGGLMDKGAGPLARGGKMQGTAARGTTDIRGTGRRSGGWTAGARAGAVNGRRCRPLARRKTLDTPVWRHMEHRSHWLAPRKTGGRRAGRRDSRQRVPGRCMARKGKMHGTRSRGTSGGRATGRRPGRRTASALAGMINSRVCLATGGRGNMHGTKARGTPDTGGSGLRPEGPTADARAGAINGGVFRVIGGGRKEAQHRSQMHIGHRSH